MSSLRVRTKNKLMTALGAAKPSTNVAFDLAYSDFVSTLQRLETLDSALKAYAASIKTFHDVASLVVGAIDGLSSGDSGIASYQLKPVGVSEMQQLTGDARVACADVDSMVLRETYGRLEQEVLIPVKGWLQHARSLQNEAKAFQEQKALYDHYLRKVVALRESHAKRASTGRSEKTKNTERMFRNEQKLAATTQEYVRQSDTLVRYLRFFVVTRDAALASLLRRVLRGRAIYAERMHEATGRISALIEDGVEEGEDDGVLGQYMRVAQGGRHTGSAADRTTAASSSSAYSCGDSLPTNTLSQGLHTVHFTHKSATVFPPENERQMLSPTNGGCGFSEPPFTSLREVPKFMAAIMSSDADANRSLGDELRKMSTNVLSPSSVTMAPNVPLSPVTTTNYYDACPAAPAPSADPLMSGEWSSGRQASRQQQQMHVATFADMHRTALSGELSCFR